MPRLSGGGDTSSTSKVPGLLVLPPRLPRFLGRAPRGRAVAASLAADGPPVRSAAARPRAAVASLAADAPPVAEASPQGAWRWSAAGSSRDRWPLRCPSWSVPEAGCCRACDPPP